MSPQFKPVLNALDNVILSKNNELKLALVCLLCRGHLLIEDLPGMGKTTLAHALADVFAARYQRVQFTSDLLPLDITGGAIFNVKSQTFDFHPGPIFTQVLLADEINRASPKTQSALLEAMEERQVTIDRQTHTLDATFFVIATQNPQDQAGTHALPESQLDRFFMRLSLGFPSPQAERELILNQHTGRKRLTAVADVATLQSWQAEITQIPLNDVVVDYILALVKRTRLTSGAALSPRASIALGLAVRAWAFLAGRNYVLPDDVQFVAPYICAHRINMTLDEFQLQVIKQVPVPV
ncbi:AAA family ATPase [Pseudoalteromonas fenneropenaei]|uniref:AAA family ATPase n=1 Tax=Pseudoalteromonas fenneropenaei TaxID=1737459 RepID=A0ABV7CFJ8_9GAMM